MTNARVRKGISYVIGDTNDNENHILPINSMQYSNIRNQLFTGGRDGIIKIWDRKLPGEGATIEHGNGGDNFSIGNTNVTDNNEGIMNNDMDLDERLLKLETSISSNSLPYNSITNEFKVNGRNNGDFNIHFDWINDLQLVNQDNDLVSCSSDLSLKITNLNSVDGNQISKFENIHTDYVKKLSYFHNNQHLLASGGLDGKIVIWDLNYLKPTKIITNNNLNTTLSNSIYSLANNNANLISCGGPNNTINLFDKRLDNDNQFIKKLIGHQDNIRCLLMNENFILSGSSDTTIKLWDLRNFKILKNFNIHDDPIWCLNSTASNFETFYSADKSGNIFKTDLSYLTHDLIHDYPNMNSEFIENIGISTLIAKSSNSIISLAIENDSNSIFASTDMSLDRYYLPDTSHLSNYQYLRSFQDFEANNQLMENDLNHLNDAKTEDLNSDIYDLVSHFSVENETANNLDLQSNFSANNLNNLDNEIDDSEYNSMFVNVNGTSNDFVNLNKDNMEPMANNLTIDSTPVEILLNPVKSEQITLIPFNKKPLTSYALTPKSVIAKRLFNNKRTMLVLYLNGDIAIWDIFICRKIKNFPYNNENNIITRKNSLNENDENDNAIATNEMIKKRIQDMDDIFQSYQTTDTLNNWCEVEIKSGKLLVTIAETNFNNVEIYYDELIEAYPFLKYEYNNDAVKNNKIKVSNDDRLQLSRIFLNSIFHNYSMYEWKFDNNLREELKLMNHKKIDLKEGGNALNKLKMFSRKPSMNGMPTLKKVSSRNSGFLSATSSANASINGSGNNSLVNSANISINEIESPVNEFINSNDSIDNFDSIDYLLNENKVKYKEKLSLSPSKLPESLLKLYSNDAELIKSYFSNDEFLPYKPIIPFEEFPPNLLIIIFENSSDLGTLRDLFSFRISDLSKFENLDQNYELIKNLRSFLPRWIGQPILLDRFPIKESPKIAFQLLELDYNTLPVDKKINGKSQRKIKRLPVLESSIKLTSHNMLRVGKILTYLTEKFESRTSEMKEKIPPTQWLVLECKGQELQNNMTLQTIKTKIWKSSSDIELKFRRHFDK